MTMNIIDRTLKDKSTTDKIMIGMKIKGIGLKENFHSKTIIKMNTQMYNSNTSINSKANNM